MTWPRPTCRSRRTRSSAACRARGHEVIRHSDAHLQVLFAHDVVRCGRARRPLPRLPRPGRLQPADRTCAARSPTTSLLPLTEVELEGITRARRSPTPRSGSALCYGTGWRVPDPTFRFRTPAVTRRRFENWFGVYDLNRHFWERHIRLGRSRHWRRDATAAARRDRRGERVIDLGCGDGTLSAMLADAGREVIAVDYARSAVEAAAAPPRGDRAATEPRRPASGARLHRRRVAGGRHASLPALERARLAARARPGRTSSCCCGRSSAPIPSRWSRCRSTRRSSYDHHRPDTWHLPLRGCGEEASAHRALLRGGVTAAAGHVIWAAHRRDGPGSTVRRRRCPRPARGHGESIRSRHAQDGSAQARRTESPTSRDSRRQIARLRAEIDELRSRLATHRRTVRPRRSSVSPSRSAATR